MKRAAGLGYGVLLILSAGLSIYAFFFTQFQSGFSTLFGDEFDAVIEAILVSHWYGWLSGTQAWNLPLYFYPYKDVLGYNDAYLVYGLLSIPFRLLGANLLLAQELVYIVVKVVGFVSMAEFIANLTKRRSITAILGAAYFTLAISSSNQGQHGQLFAVAFSPLLALLLVKVAESLVAHHRSKALVFGMAFIALYASLLLTAFYMAWFFGLFAIVFYICYFAADRQAALSVVRLVARNKSTMLWLFVGFAFSIAPFLYVYVPKLHETGGQNIAAQMAYAIRPEEIVNFGPGSLLWGQVFMHIQSLMPQLLRPAEFRVGFTPDVAALLLLIFCLAIAARGKELPSWYRALAWAVLISLLLPVGVKGKSLWYLVDAVVPGAHGMRVIVRYYIFLVFPVALLLALHIERAIQRSPEATGLLVLLFSVVVIGQINTQPPVELNVRSVMRVVDGISPIPNSCHSFFVANPIPVPRSAVERFLRGNVQAMLIADHVQRPTINGIATFLPADWAFPQSPGYLMRVGAYVRNHALKGVCMYDVTTHKWESADALDRARKAVSIAYDQDVSFSGGGYGLNFLEQGWSDPESWGTWSNANSSSVVLHLSATPTSAVMLSFKSHAFVTPSHPEVVVRISINGKNLQTFVYRYPEGARDSIRSVSVPPEIIALRPEALEIRFDYIKPVSPMALGMGADPRSLALGLVWLKITSQQIP